MKMKWKVELERNQDFLTTYYNNNAEKELTALLSKAIGLAIKKDIKRKALKSPKYIKKVKRLRWKKS